MVDTSALRCSAATGIDEAEWLDAADRCDYATFFHTPGWLNAFARTFPGTRVRTVRFEFEDGVVAFFPLLETARFLGTWRSYASTCAGCYGGWVSAGELGSAHVDSMVGRILRRHPNLTWRLNPFAQQWAAVEGHLSWRDTTEILDLQDFPDENALLYNYRHNVRKQIHKAERAGLRLEEATEWTDWERYYGIYQLLLEKWGKEATSAYPLDLFRALRETPGQRVRLWIVRDGERLAGGNLNFYHGPHCVEWHAAFDPSYFNSGIRDYAVHRIIMDARARGCRIYDFNPSGGHEGTRRFKQTFGTRSLATDVIERRSGLYRSTSLRRAYRKIRTDLVGGAGR
jgi:CelD/BcsL family acetyltransferase involved in cellulose biosynthesis